MTHTITIEEISFKTYKSGFKSFILLKDDRNYVAGDTIIFQLMGNREELKMEVVNLEIDSPGLKNNYCILGLKEKE